MKIEKLLKTLPDNENELLEKYDEAAKARYELCQKIDEVSTRIGDKFSVVLKARKSDYKPLDDDLIAESSANDMLIDEYYELSKTMIAIENKLRQITKET